MIDHLAVLADIHGNRLALEAVLTDIRGRGIEHLVNLGDCLYGPLDPAGTADILMALDIPTVRGNEDRVLVEPPPEAGEHLSLDFTLGRLTDPHLHWLQSLPETAVAFEGIFMCHGSPDRDDRYLLVDIEPSGAVLRRPDALQEKLRDIKQPVVLCGHDHTPRTVPLPEDRLIVNPGSVGLQAYTDEAPFPHAMQSGSPHARYAIISRAADAWKTEHVAVAYDWDAAADLAHENDREDWVPWLRTGTVPPS